MSPNSHITNFKSSVSQNMLFTVCMHVMQHPILLFDCPDKISIYHFEAKSVESATKHSVFVFIMRSFQCQHLELDADDKNS